MGSGSGKELESEGTNTETQTEDISQANKSQISQHAVQSTAPQICDQKVQQIENVNVISILNSHNVCNDNDVKYENQQHKPKQTAPRTSFAEVKDEEIAELNYIKPDSEEINKQSQLFLTHICHRGHFSSDSQWSAQNLLQNNDAPYMSLKAYNFNANYNKCDHDWVIFKINSLYTIKITQLAMYYSTANGIQQYPSKICMQFMLTNHLKRVIRSAPDNSKWSQPYYTKPSIFESIKPAVKGQQHKDMFTVSFAAEYVDELYNNRYDQYVRISFLQSHGDTGKESKYCLRNLRLFGVPLLDDNNDLMELELNIENTKVNKYFTENKYESYLQPKPGRDDGRVLMRDDIFFVNVGHKTISVLKNMICEEYDRLNQGNVNYSKYNAKRIYLVVDGYGLVNDMMDSSVLHKTLSQIGVRQGKNNTGYYITVYFY